MQIFFVRPQDRVVIFCPDADGADRRGSKRRFFIVDRARDRAGLTLDLTQTDNLGSQDEGSQEKPADAGFTFY